MLKWIATALGFMLAVDLAFGADLPLGKWNTIDDKTGKVKDTHVVESAFDPTWK
jgi:hypothetical protein